ncbi:MAG: AraC family transcriptional regulator [Pseudomonadota bacterium]
MSGRRRMRYDSQVQSRGVSRYSAVHNQGGIVIGSIDCVAYQGPEPPREAAHFVLVLEGPGRFVFRYDGIDFDQDISVGDIGFRLPSSSAETAYPESRMVHFAVDWSMLVELIEQEHDRFDWEIAGSLAHRSPALRQLILKAFLESRTCGLHAHRAEQCLINLVSAFVDEQRPRARSGRDRPLDQRRWRLVLDRIESIKSDQTSVAELADLVGLSRSHFSRAFALRTGRPPGSYLTSMRLTSAADMLRDSNGSILDAALDAGYNNPSKFAAAFRREFGVTPTVWSSL